jgi:hypothetical protein
LAELPVIQLKEEQEYTGFDLVKVTISMSPTIGKLVLALAKARTNFDAVKKNATNPFYHKKYADLSEIIGATALPLSEQEVVVMQFPGEIKGTTVSVTTLLAHSSGEYVMSTASGPGDQKNKEGIKFDMQTVGIAITYLRRYSDISVLNLAAEDDDGNGLATGKSETKSILLPTIQTKTNSVSAETSSLTRTAAQPVQKEVESEKSVENNPLPSPEEKVKLFERIKALKLDGRIVKGFIRRETGVDYNDVPVKQFEELVQKMEKAANEGTDVLQKLVSKPE